MNNFPLYPNTSYGGTINETHRCSSFLHPPAPALIMGEKHARYGLRFPPPTAKSAFGRHDLSTAITKSVLIAYFAKIAVLIGK